MLNFTIRGVFIYVYFYYFRRRKMIDTASFFKNSVTVCMFNEHMSIKNGLFCMKHWEERNILIN